MGVRRYRQNPAIYFLIFSYGGGPVPTKQDQWKNVPMIEVLNDGTEKAINDFYVKKPGGPAISEFRTNIQSLSKNVIKDGQILMPNHIEVIISISVTEKRFKELDVDNLAKTVLDSLNNVAWEDDSQVTRLLLTKHIHPMKENGIFIGMTKLTKDRPGAIGDISLFHHVK